MVTVEGIQITAGELTRDPRLEGIDLRGKFRPIKVEVQDENHRPLAASGIRPMVLVDPSSEREVQGYAVVAGVATVIIAGPDVDLLVTAPGYQPRALNGVSEDTVVSLEPYPEVLVRIPGGAPRLPEGYVLRVSLTKTGRQRDDRTLRAETSVGPQMDRHLHPPSTPQAIDDRGEVTLQVSDDGGYAVAVSARNTATRRTAAVRDVVPAEVQVQTAAGRQVFEVRITEEALRQALAEAGLRVR
jgi:hypothetical protein